MDSCAYKDKLGNKFVKTECKTVQRCSWRKVIVLQLPSKRELLEVAKRKLLRLPQKLRHQE